ncbi:MAG: hypothetical protein JSS86_01140 [Cyanobacteria bacterium SZAS LIN-2]|nr:hypothetical protein [Cyanobacteria bacterium SZAS LIN-2]
MKSTAIFVGVNVAASIPLVFCQQAKAEGEAQLSSTADFLKSSLAQKGDAATAKSMLAGDPTFSSSRRPIRIKRDLTPTQALSNPRAVATRNAMAPVNGVKLRPFQAGRRLPSAAELQGFTAMAPQMENGTDPNALSAGVSENAYMARSADYSAPGYNNYRPTDVRAQNRARLKDAARVASGYDRRSAPRVTPGHSPVTPGQVGFPCAQQAVADMQPVRNGNPEWANTGSDLASQPVSPEMLNVAKQMAAGGAEMAQHPSGGTAGPAPFPLSLLPEASLKQFIGSTAGGAKRPQAAGGQPSYFGSWKQGQNAVASRSNLQPSGFHSHLNGGGHAMSNIGGSNLSSNMHMSSAFSSYAPMAMTGRRATPSRPAEAKHIAQNVHASTTVNVASYGPYTQPTF